VIRYRAQARVQLTLTSGQQGAVKARARVNSTGRLRVALRVPLVPLRTGHGTATLTITAARAQNHAHATARLALAAMILSVRTQRVQGCSATLSTHVAYVSRAHLRLTVQYAGQPRVGSHQTTQADRHGHALARLTVRFMTRGRRLPVLITASGQRGRLRQTENARLILTVPAACTHLGIGPT
jgi:hypothetical protein